MGHWVGINRTQDASICVLTRTGSCIAVQKERLTRVKHHWGRLNDLRDVYVPRIRELRGSIEAVTECYSSDTELENRDAYLRELGDVLFPSRPVTMINHHLAHAYSAFVPSRFSAAAVLVMDFMGSRSIGRGAWRRRGRTPTPNDVEVASLFRGRKGKDLRLIEKQVWSADRRAPVGLGPFYHFLTQLFFRGDGHEGKVMGLASYGNPARVGLPKLRVQELDVFIPREWNRLFERESYHGNLRRDSAQFAEAADVAAAGQLALEEALLSVLQWVRQTTEERALCFAGGVALNCVANGRALRESGFDEIFVPSAPNDAGTAIGCALHAARGAETDAVDWSTDYLGPFDDGEADERVLDGFELDGASDPARAAAGHLAHGRILALYQNRSEFGPRALGHRSIVADPRPAGIRDFINSTIKGREWFRPLAPVVKEENARRYFDVIHSPFMQFASVVRKKERARIPAVTHVDGTARLQTATREQEPLVAALLDAFEDLTGIGVLLNTSLNGPDEPIVETLDECLALVRRTPISGLVVNGRLYMKKDFD